MPSQSTNILAVREYERFHVSSKWNSAQKCISTVDAAAIARHQEKTGQEVIRLGYRSAQATNWVGTLGIGRKSIEVVPKIDDPAGSIDSARARENLLYMIARAGYVPLSPADVVRLADPSRPLLVAFLSLYIENLAREWRRGPVKLYVVEEENRVFLRGKLLFSQQLRHNLVHRERFYTACDEFTIDNQVSRLLKAALNACAKQVLSEVVARRARGLLGDFDDVGDVTFSPEDAARIKVDRQHNRYEPLIALARLILTATSPETGGAGEQVYSLMFDMNEVFERFIAAEMQAALAGERLAVVPQLGGRSLLHQNGRSKFMLRPDIGILDHDQVVCLLDTKWKRLDTDKSYAGVSQGDMYQMYAYGKEYNSPLVVLVYPRHGSLKDKVDEYAHHQIVDGKDRRIMVRTVDVSRPMGQVESIRGLRQDLLACLQLERLVS